MKNSLRMLSVVLLVAGAWACAASPQAPPSAPADDSGDRELKRGAYWYQKGCLRKAMDHYHAAHEHFSLRDRQSGVARSLNGLANVYRQTGDLESALLFYDYSVAAGRRCDDQTIVAQALSNKAAVLIDAGDISSAEVLLDEAKLLSRETGPVYAMVLNHRAVLMMKSDRLVDAADLLDQAASVAVADGEHARAAIAFTRGRLLMQTGAHAEAMRYFEQALDLDRQMGYARGMADDLSAMADIHEKLGRDGAALDCLDRSIKIHALLENRPAVIASVARLETLAEKTGSDIRVTVHFVNQWLDGKAVDAICQ